MSRIKTRESVKDIKVIDKAAVASERMKTALVRSKDQFENLMDDGQVTPSEYAEDKIRYAAEDVADRVGHDVSAETKKAVNKGKEAYRKHREEKRIEKNEERVNRYEERFRREEQARSERTSSQEFHSHQSAKRASEPQGPSQTRSEPASKRQAVSQKQNSIQQRKNVHHQSTARETASTGGEVRKNAVRGTRNQTIKTAERTEHTIKKTGAKGTVKSSEKAIKTAEKTSKAAIKTAEKTAKATQKAAQATAKAAQKAAEMARQAAIAAYKAAVAAAKAIAAAIKAIAAAIKELIAAIAAGGWVAVVVIIVICLIGLIVASCFGIFFSSEDTGSTQTMQQVVQYDELEMSGSRAVWPEVLSIYAVKTTNDPDNPQEVASMTDEKKQLLKDIFWEMNEISYETEEKTETVIVETDDGEGNIIEEEVEETTVYLYITVSHKTVEEMMAQYGFTEDQKAQVAELLAQDSSMWASVLYGIYGADDQIVAVALSQLGNVGGEPYWSWYGFGSRVEWCACFVSWCADQCGYIETGVIPKYAGCVNGVNWFKDRGQWADNDIEPAPGMIIFFDWDNKGSSGPQDGESDHTGIVERVEDGIVYTVEGNSGDSCRENHYAVGYYEILGYGIPAY